MTFREGGAYDYHTIFEQIKERLHQAISIAREEGRDVGAHGPLGAAAVVGAHLEQLPAYEPTREAVNTQQPEELSPQPGSARPLVPTARDSGVAGLHASPPAKSQEEVFSPPNEPPPGYEEAQAQAVGIHLDQTLREEAERK